MKIAIMQPNFIPWLGYFELMRLADQFVLLDDVQYSKNTWHNRNNLMLKDNSVFCWALPLSNISTSSTFNGLYVNQSALNFKKLRKLFHQNFAESKNYHLLEEIMNYIQKDELTFAGVNEAILLLIKDCFNITTEIVKASDLNVRGLRSQRIINICKKLGATSYLATKGAQEYMEKDDFKNLFSGEIEYFQYSCEYSLKKTKSEQIKLSALNYLLDFH